MAPPQPAPETEAAAHRFITLLSNPHNAAIVRAELQAIDGKYGQHGYLRPLIPNIPCPYTTSLLGSAWTTNLNAGEEFYSSGVTLHQAVLPAYVGCWDGDNNDGITVIDITEPLEPAYCFLRSRGGAPLTASQYLSRYRNLSELEKWASADVGGHQDPRQCREAEYANITLRDMCTLDAMPLIEAALLREAWPRESFMEFGETSPPVEPDDEVSTSIPLLADLSLEASIKHVINNGDVSDLEQLALVPGRAPQILDILRKMGTVPENGVPLIKRALSEWMSSEDSCADLSKFQLNGDSVVDVLSSCSSQFGTLDLSYNMLICTSDIPAIVATAPSVRRLSLMGCTAVEDAQLLELVRERRQDLRMLEGILHPALLTVEKPYPYPSAFTYITKRCSTGRLACASLPLFTPAQVVQALSDVIPWKANEPDTSEVFMGLLHDFALPLVGASAFQGGVRSPGVPFSERAVTSIPFLTLKVPRGEKDFWAVYFCFADEYTSVMATMRRRVNPSASGSACGGWAFLHLTAREDRAPTPAQEEPTPSPTAEEPQDGGKKVHGVNPVPLEEEYTCEVYDLDGFLTQMEREGRPMPHEDVVRGLREQLDVTDPKTGAKRVPFLDSLEVVQIESADFFPVRYGDSFFL